MTGYQAAMGLAQINKLDAVIAAKRRLAERYAQHLSGIAGLQLPMELPWAFHVYWMYGIVVRSNFGISRDELASRLRERGIETRTFFCPMNLQPCFSDIPECASRSCPVAEELWRSGLYLPSSTNLTDSDIAHVADSIRESHRR
jgi:perosamine synthetase